MAELPKIDATNTSILKFIYLALPTRAGSPQQHMLITVGPFYPNAPCQPSLLDKTGIPGENPHNCRQSVDFYSFHMRTGF